MTSSDWVQWSRDVCEGTILRLSQVYSAISFTELRKLIRTYWNGYLAESSSFTIVYSQ
jgi:hypothetical protein